MIIEHRKNLLNGIVVIKGTIHYINLDKNDNVLQKVEQNILAIPCYTWAHRGESKMTVWLLCDMKAFK